MSKRIAINELTHDNWEEEEESEEVGTFKMASSEEMARRKIKKAVRRNDEQTPNTSSVFKNFTAFSGNFSQKPSFSFSFNTEAKKSNVSKPLMNTDNKSSVFTVKNESTNLKINTSSNEQENSPHKECSDEYIDNLKSLNHGLLDWIALHINKNACINLCPVFEDYKCHFAEIQDKYLNKSDVPNIVTEKSFSVPVVTLSQDQKDLQDNITTSSSSLFASSQSPFVTAPVNETEKKPFTFGFSNNASATTSNLITFKASDTTTDASKADDTKTSVNNQEEEQESQCDILPEEVKEVKEDDAFYEKRAKLFYKKGNKFVEKGLGTLFLKDVDGKIQLIIRAATILGNILLNIILNNSFPCRRAGMNNVLLTCVPNPPIDLENPNELQTFLIRVKTEDDADELFEKINSLS